MKNATRKIRKGRNLKSSLSCMIAGVLTLFIAFGMFTPSARAWNAADWAKPEVEKAQSYGLIPDALKDADLTRPVTRAEFAAVAVKLYENFTGTTVLPVASNPFTDTKDTDVLKAYGLELVNGMTATTFEPNSLLTREQAATLMTRVEKKVYIPDWMLTTDNNYTLNFTQPTRFADDGGISGYAKTSVYFMNAKSIINGTGDNMFAPAANAARQEAIIIAVRMVEKLKGVTLDYSQGGTTQPTQPQNGDGVTTDGEHYIANPGVTTITAGNTGVTISIAKTTFAPGENVRVNYWGLTQRIFHSYSGPWFVIWDELVQYYPDSAFPQEKNGPDSYVELKMPTDTGTYSLYLEFVDPYVGHQMLTFPIVVSNSATPSEPPATSNNQDIVGTWTMGGSTLQVRKILTGKYDIRRIGLGTGQSNSPITGVSYTFNGDGTYMIIELGLTRLVIVEGQYSVSNNTISLINNTLRSTTKDNVPIIWESTMNPPNETHSFEIIYSNSLALNILYLDGKNSEPAVGYWESNDEI